MIDNEDLVLARVSLSLNMFDRTALQVVELIAPTSQGELTSQCF